MRLLKNRSLFDLKQTPTMQRDGYVKPCVVGGATVESGDVADAWVGLDPFSFARIDNDMDAIGGDGEITGLKPGGVEVADGAGNVEIDGGVSIVLTESLGAGVIPPLGGGFADGIAVAVADAVGKKGIAQGAAGQA